MNQKKTMKKKETYVSIRETRNEGQTDSENI